MIKIKAPRFKKAYRGPFSKEEAESLAKDLRRGGIFKEDEVKIRIQEKGLYFIYIKI